MQVVFHHPLHALRLTALACSFLLFGTFAMAQPGGNSAGGAHVGGGQQEVETENECIRLLEKTRAPEVHHFQQPHRPLVLVGEEGTGLFVPPNAFVYEDGTPVVGEVEILLTEVANKPELILSNLPTISNGQMLVSGGVVRIEALADGKRLKLAPGKSMLVNFPGGTEQGMQLFKGKYDAAGVMNWVPIVDDPQATVKSQPKLTNTERAPMPAFLDYGKVDPKTFMFADGDHSLNAFVLAMLQTSYRCVGNDNIYVEATVDANGRVTSAKTLTGKNPCFRLSIEEVVTTLVFDATKFNPNQTVVYFDVRPTIVSKNDPNENMFASMGGMPNGLNSEQIQAAIGEYMDQEKAQNFVKNAFAVTDLGWINCDKFYSNPAPKVSVVAGVTNNELVGKTKAFLVFEDMNSVIEGEMTSANQYTFRNIPEGLKAKVVILGYKTNTGPYLSQTNVITKAGKVTDASLAKVTEQELKNAVAAL